MGDVISAVHYVAMNIMILILTAAKHPLYLKLIYTYNCLINNNFIKQNNYNVNDFPIENRFC